MTQPGIGPIHLACAKYIADVACRQSLPREMDGGRVWHLSAIKMAFEAGARWQLIEMTVELESRVREKKGRSAYHFQRRKTGAELVVGDVITGISDESRTITGFEEHPGVWHAHGKHYSARVAKSGDWGITIFDDDLYRQASTGAWVDNHQWFHYEGRNR